jgi:RNA recognition motif-containing protein
MMNIYVGNLPYDTTDEELQRAFSAFGSVQSTKIIRDPYTGKSKGFGFVEMPGQAEAQAAIDGLSGREFKGRTLNVNKARTRSDSHAPGSGRREFRSARA